jgi:hypothetical protein
MIWGWNWPMARSMSTRKLLIAVAIVGLYLGVGNLVKRRKFYQGWGIRHAVVAVLFNRGCSNSPRSPDRVRYHESLSEKYFDAAERPWLSVEPDPPRP